MNLCNLGVIRDVLKRHGTDVKKGFGQNFLINPQIPFDIAEESYNYHTSVNNTAPCVLEIGPGIGALSCELGERYERVVCVEIDKTLIPILDETLADYPNIEIINEDFLKLDLKSFVNEKFGENPVSVCANLPYYITTPIIMKLLEEGKRENGKNMFSSITVMVQKEVAERLCASEKDSEYGAITASVSYYGKVKKLFNVAPGNFHPAPSVTSSVIRIELYKDNPHSVKDEKALFSVITGAFAQRRKTLLNSLSSYFSHIGKDKISEIITSCGFDINIRGERLSIDDFCRLADKFYEEKQK